MPEVEWFDTTCRDGGQSPQVNLNGNKKETLVNLIDKFGGISYIEVGYPAVSDDEAAVFRRLKNKKHESKLVVFGSTIGKDYKNHPEQDPGLQALVNTEFNVACVFGKTWKNHIENQLRTDTGTNLELIYNTVKWLKSQQHISEVVYDAEHFFSGFYDKTDGFNGREYALKTIEAALKAGADRIVLCDTKGGMLPKNIREVLTAIKERFGTDIRIGFHGHNDSGCAVANSLEFIDYSLDLGFKTPQIQGTIGGIGERCGNANLLHIALDALFKLNLNVGIDRMKAYSLAKEVARITGVEIPDNEPYFGRDAFRHKAGQHFDALGKGAIMSHINPADIRREETYVLSDQIGGLNVEKFAEKFGYGVKKDERKARMLQRRIKDMVQRGYDIDGNHAEQYLLAHYYLGGHMPFFINDSWKTIAEGEGVQPRMDFKSLGSNGTKSETKLKGHFNELPYLIVAESEHGPVSSQLAALKKTIRENASYSWINDIDIVYYHPTIAEDKGADSTMKVVIDLSDGKTVWRTEGVSDNILGASYNALKKGLEYRMLREEIEKKAA